MGREDRQHLWSIIIAATEEPKQFSFARASGPALPRPYRTFAGGRSPFQHTMDRADSLAPPERQVAVIAREHRETALEQLGGRITANLIFQPRDCGSAAAVLLPLTYVRAWDPDATVVITPPDRCLVPIRTYLNRVSEAVAAADRLPRRVILLGAASKSRLADCGWILPGQSYRSSISSRLRTVRRVAAKSPAAGSDGEAAGLWNTSIIVAKAKTLWNLGTLCLPETAALFSWLYQVVGTYHESEVLDAIYRRMPRRSVTADLLHRIRRHLAVLELTDVTWADAREAVRPVSPLDYRTKSPVPAA